ncbi:M64 family metallopeptidase [Streptomyces sp. NPDC058423]|uniref:M64 family metallopeptidase n=1 Tax=unclassified Streptomyces TaxID=2593676 RepID=UPI003649DE1E
MDTSGTRLPGVMALATAGALLLTGLLGPATSASAVAGAPPTPSQRPTASVASSATGSANVVPVQTTGPVDKRFNLVFLGDGYTAAESGRFRADVDRHLNVLWSIEPFASYRSYVNVWAVEVPSAESGVDCDPSLDAPRRDTPLGMGFWGGCNAGSGAANALADLVGGLQLLFLQSGVSERNHV